MRPGAVCSSKRGPTRTIQHITAERTRRWIGCKSCNSFNVPGRSNACKEKFPAQQIRRQTCPGVADTGKNTAQQRRAPPRFQDYPSEESPLWAFGGATALAANAGYVNIVVLALLGVPISHVTGSLARLTHDIGAAHRLASVEPILAVVGAFALGALVSGVLTGNHVLRHDRNYGLALMLEGILLAVATALAVRGDAAAAPVAAGACGLQNALATTYRGVIIRTTHITGLVTDIAVILGHKLRHKRLYPYKLMLLILLLAGFLGGGFAGTLAYLKWGAGVMGLASAACLVSGLIYFIYRVRMESEANPSSLRDRRR